MRKNNSGAKAPMELQCLSGTSKLVPFPVFAHLIPFLQPESPAVSKMLLVWFRGLRLVGNQNPHPTKTALGGAPGVLHG
jgi:hypothetical protein